MLLCSGMGTLFILEVFLEGAAVVFAAPGFLRSLE
jgi:hypothetical protein